MSSTPRLAGLDTLRALAIVLVFANHYMGFVTFAPTFGVVSRIGWAGVDLFFALSGYLIGNQLFAGLQRGTFSLPRFAARRLLRTLPNYYVVLALYAFWPPFMEPARHEPWWEYFTFTLNWGLMPGTRFSHSWSLCVEEQFYFVLPLVAVLIAACRRAKVLWWLVLLAGFGAGMWLRHQGWLAADPPARGNAAFYREIYYATLCRFDELLAGVLLALIRQHHPAAWQRITAFGNWTLLAGLVVTGLTLNWFLDDHFGHRASVVGYPLLALGFGLLVLAALSPGSLLARVRVPGAASIAVWSYAIYLVHKQLCVVMAEALLPYGIDAAEPLGIALLAAGSIGAGWLLYFVIETPFMKLRERYVAASAPREGALPAAT
ncbi:peptidoglycan/LPS O-acetylase OafA/YrhL [Pseudoduganella lurida]|uniref:Peptidoglycan/LPS O-acetylase OafA/YrhL n=1 Tax=Pseudoduganella lurida TaxID=1036180 RepID=A0A562RLW8_9BURK|nr:acyltransferase [Pseudoduganella lurida]TWI69604.1 peptidoglycan/LPS O-acetylase OafA/YrhL [Pseudoduganella lurida]